MFAKLSSYSSRGIFYKPIFAGFLLLNGRVSTEEEYMWTDAIVTSPFEMDPDYSPLDNLIHSTTFKEIVLTNDSATLNKWFTIDQGESLKPIRIFIQNRSDSNWDNLGYLHICIGNDPSSPTAPGNTCSTEPINNGGFIILDLPTGRYIFLDRRDNASEFNLSTAIAF